MTLASGLAGDAFGPVLESFLLSFLTSVCVGGALVWFYNRYLTNLRESYLKKGVSLSILPVAIVAGAAHFAAMRLGYPVINGFAAVGAVIFLLSGVTYIRRIQFNRDSRLVRGQTRERAIDHRALPAPVSAFLKLISPINEVDRLQILRREVVIEGLHADMDGYRILFLTDLHVHKWMRKEFYNAVIAEALSLKADAILLGGDYVSKPYCCDMAADAMQALKQHPRVIAVRGNHDFWTRPSYFAEMMKKIGAELLTNSAATLRRGAGEVALIGLESPYIPLTMRESFEIEAKLPAGVPRIGIVHTPQVYGDAERLGCQLAFAGHTHGGQVRLPFFGTTLAACSVSALHSWGCGRLGRMMTITSNGIGAFYPLRFLCPPQIIEVTMRRG
ncbi:hypothetical protein BH09SUM1_BH09SUM1_11600 [soil metagenome]